MLVKESLYTEFENTHPKSVAEYIHLLGLVLKHLKFIVTPN